MDHMQALPDDVIADILRRLKPRNLATSRCVRKAWRNIVDARRLLLPHVLPHSVHGIFINYISYERLCLFARPSAQPAINGNINFLPNHRDRFDEEVVDHCNGLLLYRCCTSLYVVNPATRWWDALSCAYGRSDEYLVFDPATSPHYEVFSIPHIPEKMKVQYKSERLKKVSACLTSLASPLTERRGAQVDLHDLMEWPPSVWTLNVFSSSTRQWQERSFVREGRAAGTLTNIRLDPLEPISKWWGGPGWRYSAYWQGSLYVHCRGAFVARFSLSDCKYQVIKAPVDTNDALFLGKSEKGVYLATFHGQYELQVWILTEFSGRMDWVLKRHIEKLGLHGLKGFEKTWTLGDDNDDDDYDYDYDYDDDFYDEKEEEDKENEEGKGEEEEEEDDEEYENEDEGDYEEYENKDEEDDEVGVPKENNEMVTGEGCEWNSDDDNVLNIEDGYAAYDTDIYFLGFHPYKEVVFLALSRYTGVAYHLNSSKVQYLGDLCPKDYHPAPTNGLLDSFPYTPCLIGELLKHPSETRHRN